MLQYLIIQLDDTSTSYCHYEGLRRTAKLMSLDILKQGILYAMKENLNIQILYPDYELPKEYKEAINSIDHYDIVSSLCEDGALLGNAEVVVFHDWTGIDFYSFNEDTTYVLRTPKIELFDRYNFLKHAISNAKRVNLVITDIETFTEDDFEKYKNVLNVLSTCIEQLYVDGKAPQLNILTDRILLSEMNNCNAGVSNITLAPDGNFYVCPAFYNMPAADGKEKTLDDVCHKGFAIGNIKDGLDIKNAQLYKLDHAPLCRKCEAYQCKRCVWLNRMTTNDVNTPSHEQCVVTHLERNASRTLLNNIRRHGNFLPEKEEIKEIDYLDPFDKKDEW